jgi:hypothetical protein
VLVLLMVNSTAELRRLGWIAGDTDHGDAGAVRATNRWERLRLRPRLRLRFPALALALLRHVAH